MKKAVKWFIPVFIILLLAGSFLVYAGIYYHADATALAALESDDAVAARGVNWKSVIEKSPMALILAMDCW